MADLRPIRMTLMPALVALLVLGGFFGALAWLLWTGAEPGSAAGTMLEAVRSGFFLTVGYYLGSSLGSKQKDRPDG